MQLLYKINNSLIEKSLVKPYQYVLIAVSGGQDSICILNLLSQLKIKWRWKLGIVHCDHQWSSTSKNQAEHVAKIASSMEINYYQAVAIQYLRHEASAREWRYQIIQRIALEHNYNVIVTAHNASDRIETLLYNIIRGSGLHGIQSMSWKRKITNQLAISISGLTRRKNISYIKTKKYYFCTFYFSLSLIRPLLNITGTELYCFARECNLPIWIDLTNKNLKIRRNRIRHQLLPYLRKFFNPKIDQALAKWVEIVNAENIYIEKLSQFLFFQVIAKQEIYLNQSPYIHGEILRSLPIALQRRIFKHFLDFHTNQNLNFYHIEQLRLWSHRNLIKKQNIRHITYHNKSYFKKVYIHKILLPGQFQLSMIGPFIFCFKHK
uniref:tRNA(Ile)-lysidine synthase, chloroplastic n=1 Tax=Netrium digitus TaxID=43946 RepID=A0A191T571_9VIRI|nr:tRNA(Ile)-lysidine synthetase [Netrium digitus]ANI25546.1 tRNA(Ile)-lysidine synthetase [Netrium digitus]